MHSWLTMSHRLRSLTGSLFTALLIAGCGPSHNACVGAGNSDPSLDSCFEDENDASSCDAFNAEGLNGDTWTFYGTTCPEKGFDYQCPSGTYKLSDTYCG